VRRGPHAEWPGSVGVPGAVMGVCVVASLDLRDRRSCTCSFEDDSPMVEELGGLLVPAAGCASAWHNVGDDDAGGGGLFQSSLPVDWGWWCVVLGVFVLFRVCVRVVDSLCNFASSS
jgi:hypothetical protein